MSIDLNPLNRFEQFPEWFSYDLDVKPSSLIFVAQYLTNSSVVSEDIRLDVTLTFTDGTLQNDWVDNKKGWCAFYIPEGKEIRDILLEAPNGYPSLENYYTSHYLLY